MFKMLILIIIFYALIPLHLKTFKRQKSLLFCLAFTILNFFVIQNPYVSSYGDKYSICFIVCFIAGIFFNIRELIIFALFTTFGHIINNHGIQIAYFVPDIINSIFSIGFGYYIGKFLYNKNKINPFSSILYTAVISSIYSIIYLVIVSIYSDISVVMKFDLTYYIYSVVFTVVLFFTLVLVYIFGDKNVDDKNTLLHIFTRRFRILLIILFFITLFINNRIFSFYITNKCYENINDNYYVAISTIKNNEEKFGEEGMYKNEEALANISEWYTRTNGAVFFMDEDFNLLNQFSEFVKNKIMIKGVTPDGFRDILKYKEKDIVKYNNNGIELYVKYTKYKNSYIVVFLPTSEVENNVSVISYLTSYAIIITMLAIYLLVYYSMRNNIALRIQGTNNKLQQISKGDYNVVFNDESSKELKELSDHINNTVKSLKNTITEVKEKNKQELELAKKIQESQLRTDDIKHIAFDVSAKNIPAEEVGGDFYDYFYIDYRHAAFLIADVSGKGIPGAMFMIKAKNAFINFAKQKLTIEEIVKRTNQSLCQNNVAMMFVTCFIGIIDLKTGLLKYINCGHNAPIICRIKGTEDLTHDNYDISYISSKQQRILGIDEEAEFIAEDITLKQGDKITLYTDGITEARNKNKDFYKEDRLKNIYNEICNLSPKELNEKIIDSVKQFSKDTVQFDDITILTFSYTGTRNEILLDATEKDINIGKEFLNKFIKLYDMPIDIERNLKIVYDEIYSNIKNYAYNNNGGELIFKVNLYGKDTIEMIFMDKGEEFNPIEHKNEKTERNIEEKYDGGMGLMFCKNIMDEMKYERIDNYNVLYLYKKFV